MAKTYQDIQNELGVNEGNSIVELIAKMNDYNVVSPSEITKIISVSVDRLENQVTGKAKEVKRRMYEPVTDDTKGIVSVLNKRIVLLDMIINKLKLEALDILNQHRTNYSNPHNVTKTQVGLNNVDNTSDLDKPISNATQTALNEISSNLDNHKNNTSNPHNVTKAQVGLSKVLDKEQLGKEEKAVDSDKLNGQKADYYAVKYSVENEAAYDLDFSMDSSSYVLTVYLKNKSGVVLTQKSIDLPLETMVIGGRYDNNTKKIILTLRGVDNPVEFSVADLISGLQGEITENNKLRVELIDGLTTAYLGLEKVINKGMDEKPTENSDNYVKSGGVYTELNKKIDKSQGSSNANKVFMTDSSGNLILTNTIPSSSLPATGVSVDTAKQLEKTDGTKIGADEVALKKDVSEVDIDLEGTGTIVSIPENATGYGTIEKLGGKSYKSENLLSENTFSVNTNDSVYWIYEKISINTIPSGTYSISFNKPLNLAVYLYDSNNNELLNRVVTDGTHTFTLSTNATKLSLLNRGSTINDTLQIMLNKGSTALPYQPYFEGIKTEYPTNVKVVGKNLFNNVWLVGGLDWNTLDVRTDGVGYHSDYIYLPKHQCYVTTDIDVYYCHYDINKNYIGVSSTENLNSINSKDVFYIRLFNNGSTKPVSNVYNGLQDYNVVYTEHNLPQTNIINYVSTQLQTNHSWTQENASKWLGLGVSDSNIIDYANKKAIVKYNIVDLGSLNFIYDSNYSRWHIFFGEEYNAKLVYNEYIANIMSDNYIAVSANTISNENINGIALGYSGNLLCRNGSATERPTGLLIYELATPIEIDLSSLETEEHFECESNGSIIHDNLANYKYSFPVSLKGQVELNFEHDKEQQRDIDSLKKEIDELDNKKVPTTRKINGKALNEDINLSASDVGARPSSWTPSKTDIGLGKVDNTSDTDKPISNATQTALNNKANSSDLNAHTGNTNNPHNVTKTQLGLENVDNTKDSDKNVASAKILKNNDIKSFTLSAGIIEGINFNQNSMYLIYNNTWCFIIRIGEKNQYFTIQSTVCYNESTSRPLWFLYQNLDVFKLYLKTTKTVNNNEFATVYETDETFYYKLLSTD